MVHQDTYATTQEILFGTDIDLRDYTDDELVEAHRVAMDESNALMLRIATEELTTREKALLTEAGRIRRRVARTIRNELKTRKGGVRL